MAQLKDLLVSGAARFLNGIDIIGDLTLAGNLLPADNGTYNLGSKDNHWKHGYIDKLGVNPEGHDLSYVDYSDKSLFVIGDSLFEGKINIQGDILPTEKDIYNLGSKDLYWKNINGSWLRANPKSSSTDGGITLYGNDATYGIMFRGTANLGKLVNTTKADYGISSDWATYFTMSNTTNRGWVFRRGDTNVGGITGNGTFITTVSSGTHLAANQGKVAVDLAAAVGYNMLTRIKSISGVFTEGVYNNSRDFLYTTDTVVNAGANSFTYGISLLNENGLTQLRNLVVDNTNHINSTTAVGKGAVYIYKNELSSSVETSQLVVGSINERYNGATGGGDVAIELWRGKNTSWQLLNNNGILKFKNNYNATAIQNSYNQNSLWLNGQNGAGYIPNLKIADASEAGFDTNYRLHIDGTTYTTGQVYINVPNDTVELNQNGALVIGEKTGFNIGFDSNEIQARNNSAASNLYLNFDGGLVQIGSGGLESSGNVYPRETNSKNLGSQDRRWKALYIGSADSYGTNAQPIYWFNGVPTKLTSTIGSTTKPVYLNAGSVTASDATVGSATKPVYMNFGTITAGTYELKATVNSGTSNKLAYYSGNNAVSSYTSTVGSSTVPVYLNAGVPTAISSYSGTSQYANLLQLNRVSSTNLSKYSIDVGSYYKTGHTNSVARQAVWSQKWTTTALTYTNTTPNAQGQVADNQIAITDYGAITLWLSGSLDNNGISNSLWLNMDIKGRIFAEQGFAGSGANITNLNAANISTGVLPVTRGGTGKSNGNDAANYFLNELTIGTATPEDNDYYISQYIGGGTTIQTYHRRPVSSLWTYIKNKLYETSIFVQRSGDTMTGSLTVQTTINGTSIATSWLQGLKHASRSALYISDLDENNGYCSWIRQTNPFEQKWFSMGIYKTSFYLIGSSTNRTENGYDYGLSFNISDGDLKAPWFNGPVTHLGNYYRSGNNRPTSCDFPILGNGTVSYFLATSSMTTNKPPRDAHCLHLAWDNTSGYDLQMGIAHGDHPHIYIRGQNAGTWYPWRDVPCVYYGTSAPSNNTGSNGDIYIKYS